jgi:hypothetical protein
MRPGDAARFTCYECGIAFDLKIAPTNEWAEELDENDFEGGADLMPPIVCPFCQSDELRQKADQPIIFSN